MQSLKWKKISYVDGVFQGQMSQCNYTDNNNCPKNITLDGKGIQPGQRLDLIVESYGRLTYPILSDPSPFNKVNKFNP